MVMSRLHVNPGLKRTGDFETVNWTAFDLILVYKAGTATVFFRSAALATDFIETHSSMYKLLNIYGG